MANRKINGRRYSKNYYDAYNKLKNSGYEDLAELLARRSGLARRGLGYSVSDVLGMKQDRINKQNEYLWDIQAQEAAGLNSALMYNNAGTAQMIETPESSAQEQFGAGLDNVTSSLGSLFSACQLGIQAWNAKKDNAVKDANINLIKSQEALNVARTADINQQVEFFAGVKDYRRRVEENNADISDLLVLYHQAGVEIQKYGIDKAKWDAKTAEFESSIKGQDAAFHAEFLSLQKSIMDNQVQLGALQVAYQLEQNANQKRMIAAQIRSLNSQADANDAQARLLAKKADYVDQEEFVSYMTCANAFLSTVGNAQVNSASIKAGFMKAGFSAEVAAEKTQNLLANHSKIINNVLSSINMRYGKSGFYFTTGENNYGGDSPQSSVVSSDTPSSVPTAHNARNYDENSSD